MLNFWLIVLSCFASWLILTNDSILFIIFALINTSVHLCSPLPLLGCSHFAEVSWVKNIVRENGQDSQMLSTVEGWWHLTTVKDGCLCKEGSRRKSLAHIGNLPKLQVQAAGRGKVGRVLSALRAQADT